MNPFSALTAPFPLTFFSNLSNIDKVALVANLSKFSPSSFFDCPMNSICWIAFESASNSFCLLKSATINLYLFLMCSKSNKHHSHKKRKDSLEGSLDRLLVPEVTSTQATSAYFKCKHWICRKVRLVKTTVLFIWDQLLVALIYLDFIIMILICF